jgi:hypothetical protein
MSTATVFVARFFASWDDLRSLWDVQSLSDAGNWLAESNDRMCVVSDEKLAKAFSTRDEAQAAASKYWDADVARSFLGWEIFQS